MPWLEITELWLEKGFNLHVLVFVVLASASFTSILIVSQDLSCYRCASTIYRAYKLPAFCPTYILLKKIKISYKLLILDVTLHSKSYQRSCESLALTFELLPEFDDAVQK